MSKKPRKNSLVKFDFTTFPPEFWKKYPFREDGVYVYLGEIVNMKGHCIVVDHNNGQIFSGYHIEDFVELTEEESYIDIVVKDDEDE
jgi:hypothetical protein